MSITRQENKDIGSGLLKVGKKQKKITIRREKKYKKNFVQLCWKEFWVGRLKWKMNEWNNNWYIIDNNSKWKMRNEKWEMRNEKWKMKHEKRKMKMKMKIAM